MTTSPTFERLPRNPRPIAHDLKALTGLADLRDVAERWLQLLRKWRASPRRIDYHFLLASDPTMGGDQISDRTSAKTWLQKEDDQWNGPAPGDGFLKDKELKWPVGADDEKYKNEDLENAVRLAFGFWLFAVEAFSLINEKALLEDGWCRPSGPIFMNMTEHWPELTLSSLP